MEGRDDGAERARQRGGEGRRRRGGGAGNMAVLHAKETEVRYPGGTSVAHDARAIVTQATVGNLIRVTARSRRPTAS